MDHIQYVLSDDIVPAPALESFWTAASTSTLPGTSMQAPISFSQPPNMAVTLMQPPRFRSPSPVGSIQLSEDRHQTFERNSPIATLPGQMWRSASTSSLNANMLMEQPDAEAIPGRELGKALATGQDSGKLVTDPAWRLPRTRSTDIQQAQSLQAAGQVLMNTAQYRSWSGTTSSSLSSQEDIASARLSISPEHPFSLMASSQRHPPPSDSISSARRPTSSASPDGQLADSIFKNGSTTFHHLRNPSSGGNTDIQNALSLMLADGKSEHQWRKICNLDRSQGTEAAAQIKMQGSTTIQNNTVSEISTTQELRRQARGPFTLWRHARVQAPNLQRNDPQNQFLLRRCINMMKQISEVPHDTQTNVAVGQRQSESISQQGAEVSRSSPEPVTDVARVQERRTSVQVDPPIIRIRSQGGPRMASMMHAGTGGAIHAGHSEAATNHMMAERRRRVKQKENFNALRSLVPIISKADKASTLVDAIAYLNYLQNTVRELEASKKEVDERYKTLERNYKELEQRNKELEALFYARGSSSSSQQPRQQKLHSMQSL